MAKKQKVNARAVKVKMPAGFTAVAVGGGFGAWWDFHKQKSVTGKVVGIDSYTTTQDVVNKKGKVEEKEVQRRILRVQGEKGVTVNVGESFALKELFDMKGLKGRSVFIQFLGQKTFKNKKGKVQKINQFSAAVK